MNWTLTSPEEQERFGRRLAPLLGQSCLVFLSGDLGTGKTTLARGILQGLGHTGHVKSPTYTLIEPYELAGRTIYHLDLYRLGDPEELEDLGLRDLLAGESGLLIEWPERGAPILPPADLEIHITYSNGGRVLALTAGTRLGGMILERLGQALMD